MFCRMILEFDSPLAPLTTDTTSTWEWGRTKPPTDDELSAELGVVRALWDELLADLALPVQEWNCYSPKAGWSLKLKQGKRTIVYLAPCHGSFRVAFILGAKAVEAARASKLSKAVIKIMDVKCPGSGESDKNYWDNVNVLSTHDEVKFVIGDRADYDFARRVIAEHDLPSRVAAILMSPVHGVLDPRLLSEWMLADHLPARLQLQLHKFIWSPETRGV